MYVFVNVNNSTIAQHSNPNALRGVVINIHMQIYKDMHSGRPCDQLLTGTFC